MKNAEFNERNTVEASISRRARCFDGIVCLAEKIRYVSLIFSAVAVLSVVVLSVFNDMMGLYKPLKMAEITVSDPKQLPYLLWSEGIIEYPALFSVYLDIKGAYVSLDGKLNARVDSGMDYKALLDSFTFSEKDRVLRLTFKNGATTDEIIDTLVSNGIGSREGFERAINSYPFEYDFVNDIEWSDERDNDRRYRLDGYLYPDTYDFYTNRSETYYIYKMLDRFSELVGKLYDDMAKIGYTVDEMVTVASLIQRSTSRAAQYRYVSEVIYNRLHLTDTCRYLEIPASNAYATGYGEGWFGIPSDALKAVDSPYNTYKKEGLPPGAVCNPDINAMICACRPSKNGYKYFVTAKSGEVLPATNEEEHRINCAAVDGQ